MSSYSGIECLKVVVVYPAVSYTLLLRGGNQYLNHDVPSPTQPQENVEAFLKRLPSQPLYSERWQARVKKLEEPVL